MLLHRCFSDYFVTGTRYFPPVSKRETIVKTKTLKAKRVYNSIARGTAFEPEMLIILRDKATDFCFSGEKGGFNGRSP